jgi:hypothetical protein
MAKVESGRADNIAMRVAAQLNVTTGDHAAIVNPRQPHSCPSPHKLLQAANTGQGETARFCGESALLIGSGGVDARLEKGVLRRHVPLIG